MTTYPIKPVKLPKDLANVTNGNLPLELLRPFGPSGVLHRRAARQATAMVNAAKKAGIDLTYTYGGTYRTYAQQVQLFLQRFEKGYVGGAVNKQYLGEWYHLKPGMANAAAPGTSLHGWGLAVDFASGTHPDNAKSLTPQALSWLLANADRYGFSWELQSEPWHLRNYAYKLRLP